jgi:OOP family OmpA-OmpF porin
VLVGSLSAVGYGETRPVADNDSPAGRETNRRIEFTLVGPVASAGSTLPPTDPPDAAEAATPEDPVPGEQATGAPEAGTPTAPAPTPASPLPAEVPAAAALEPEEPFVSSAPAEQTRRARRRPESE